MGGKNWWEVILLPVVVALVGSGATYFITKAQIESSERLATAERDSSEKKARLERQLKLLEMFNAKIVSPTTRDRQIAVRLLHMMDPELATKLAEAIAANEEETPTVRESARIVVKESQRGYAFPVVRSLKDLTTALDWSRRLRDSFPDYPIEVYLAENDYYAVTLGGYLDRDEAAKRVKVAREKNIAADAYVWQSTVWGENLFK